jgi:hypothetical protein
VSGYLHIIYTQKKEAINLIITIYLPIRNSGNIILMTDWLDKKSSSKRKTDTKNANKYTIFDHRIRPIIPSYQNAGTQKIYGKFLVVRVKPEEKTGHKRFKFSNYQIKY